MRISASRSLLLFIGLALCGCAPTMYVETGGNSSVALSKSAPHYIVPPAATATTESKMLYSDVVTAFEMNQIALTKNRKDAAFVVTWGSQDQTKQVRSVQASGMASYPSLNSNSYGGYGMAPTGPEYSTVMRSVRVETFMIHVLKNVTNGTPSIEVWTGSADVGLGDVRNAAPVINGIVARYGTTFKGDTQIK